MAKKSYRVAGTQKVLGYEPGTRFQADLDSDQETRLLRRGSITRVRSDAKNKASEKSGTDNARQE